MDRDYLQEALQTFNGSNWYNWKKDWTGEQRMSYENVIITKDGAEMPSEAEVNAKIQALKDEDTAKADLKASARQKLMDGEPLTEDEAKTIVL